MALSKLPGGAWDFYGLSSDTKPTTGVLPGMSFLAIDTGMEYRYTGSAWYLRPSPVYLTNGVDFVDVANGVAVVEQGQFDYEAVAAGQTDQVMGVTGAAGDFLHKVIVQVTTSGATGIASIKDGGGSSIPLVPASTPIGVYVIELNIVSTAGAWKVTTGAAATALGIGRFTA